MNLCPHEVLCYTNSTYEERASLLVVNVFRLIFQRWRTRLVVRRQLEIPVPRGMQSHQMYHTHKL